MRPLLRCEPFQGDSMLSHAQARIHLAEAWLIEFPGIQPSLAELQAIQAIGLHEGSYGDAKAWGRAYDPNNWGAVQCTTHKPPDCQPGHCFPHGDSDPFKGKYIWCYREYATPTDGAGHLVRLLTKYRPTTADAIMIGDASEIARTMYYSNYYGGGHRSAALNVNAYRDRIMKAATVIAQSLKEELTLVPGPTYACDELPPRDPNHPNECEEPSKPPPIRPPSIKTPFPKKPPIKSIPPKASDIGVGGYLLISAVFGLIGSRLIRRR